MGDMRYSGKYAEFSTKDKKEGSILNGADCLVGDVFEIVFKTEDNIDIAWMRNRFGDDVAFFDPRTSRELAIMNARGWSLRAILSFVAYTSDPKPESYWGEAAIIGNNPQYDDEVNAFVRNVGKLMADGQRPNINLEKAGIDQLISSGGAWTPKKSATRPKMKPGTAIVKDHLLPSERVVEKSRERKPGCYIISWAFIIVMAAGIIGIALKLFGLW